MKKAFSILLASLMVVSMFPFAGAEESIPIDKESGLDTMPVVENESSTTETTPAAESESSTTETTPAAESESPAKETTPAAESESPAKETTPAAESESPVKATTPAAESESPVKETTPAAESGTPVPTATPIPTPVATATAVFNYTQEDKLVMESVTVTESDLSGNVSDTDKAKEYEIVTDVIEKTVDKEKSDSDISEHKEYDIAVTDGEEIIKQTTKEETIATVVGDPGIAIENENIAGCVHTWQLVGDIQQATESSFGIRKYQCTNEGCTAVKYEEIPMTKGDENTTETATEITKTSGIIINTDETKPTYSFENNILTIGGNGIIPDYKVTITESDSVITDVPVTDATPWADFASKVIEVIIGSGITKIGDFAFANMIHLQQVDIYAKNVTIGDYAFAGDEELTSVNFLDKNAEPAFEHADAAVAYTDDSGDTTTGSGSTAFAEDGAVSVNYSCVNPKKTEMKTAQKFALATVGNTDLHLNCNVIPGYAPTETEYGRTDGVYCLDCKQTITAQQIIYPNGKAESGKYNIIVFSQLKDVPKSLEGTKYDTLEKVAELQNEFTDALATEFKAEFKTELTKNNTAIYDIELVDLHTATEPDTYIVNIPYPSGTSAYGNDFVAVQLKDDEEIEAVDTFLTNKGIQIEVETLKPVGVAWKNK